jgi:hypothetical protein
MLACEQSINGLADKHKGVVQATHASCSRETGCSAAKWGDTTTRTMVSTLVCSLSRARAGGRVHSSGQEGRVSPWRACAHGLDRESRGVRPLGCMRLHLCRRQRRGHGGDTKRVHGDDTETRAQRADLGDAVFRVEVAERVRTWGRWLDRHTCAGALGFAATTRRSVGHSHRQVKQRLDPSIACVCVRVERRRHGHGGDKKLMACTRQGNKERGTARDGPTVLVRHISRRTNSRAGECTCTDSVRKNRASARWWCVRAKRRRHSRGDGTTPTTCARQGFLLTRLLARERQGLGSTVACSACGCRRQTGARRHTSKQRNDTIARQRSTRGDDGSGTCKATGSARWPALRRRRVCAAARFGTAVQDQHR